MASQQLESNLTDSRLRVLDHGYEDKFPSCCIIHRMEGNVPGIARVGHFWYVGSPARMALCVQEGSIAPFVERVFWRSAQLGKADLL